MSHQPPNANIETLSRDALEGFAADLCATESALRARVSELEKIERKYNYIHGASVYNLMQDKAKLESRVAELENLLVSAMEQRKFLQTDAENFWSERDALRSRVAELEEERDRYQEALETLAKQDYHLDLRDIAREALNPSARAE